MKYVHYTMYTASAINIIQKTHKVDCGKTVRTGSGLISNDPAVITCPACRSKLTNFANTLQQLADEHSDIVSEKLLAQLANIKTAMDI